MKILSITDSKDIPKGFTGIAEYPNGDREWYKEGKLHREDGPAIEWANGEKEWYKEGKRHRTDGHAIECRDGTKEWWVNGVRYFKDNNITGKIFIGKKSKYGIEWLRFLTDQGIEEYPIIPGFKQMLVQYFSIEEYVSLQTKEK